MNEHRSRALSTVLALLLALGAGLSPTASNAFPAPVRPQATLQTSSGEVASHIRRRIETASGAADLPAAGERIHTESSTRRFYEGRQFQPAWSRDGEPLPRVKQLVESVRSADRHGLLPSDYHLEPLEESLEALERPALDRALRNRHLADLDLLASDAYLLLSSHLLGGRVDPESFESNWVATRRSRDLVAHLEDAIANGRIRASLEDLDPPQPEYGRLVRGLDRYREIAQTGGWPTVSSGSTLRPGDEDERIPILRERLRVESYEPGRGSDPMYDSDLEKAVRTFQERHGLEADGVIGPQTLQELNVSADARADQIALNMERWRWLPQELGSPHVLVNIAGFRLDVVEQNRSVMNMRVIVGRTYRTTPVFSDRITYLVFSPYWNVPHSIATQDILPQVKQNPTYLQQQNMRVFQGWASDARAIDPGSIDWSRLSTGNFPYRLRQEPGPNNALGTVKFMFPNRFNVYLHDTPARALFSQAVRTFSSGCIRVEHPGDLAAYLLRENQGWTSAKIDQARNGDREQTVYLSRAVPVHMLYWTAWVDDDDTIHFHRDVYGRDARLETALAERAPSLQTFP